MIFKESDESKEVTKMMGQSQITAARKRANRLAHAHRMQWGPWLRQAD